MLSLDRRLTHTYVGTYQHEDKWESIGRVDELGTRELPLSEEDEEDMCEPNHRLVFCHVTSEASDEDIRQALRDTYTQWGCACEHDCCGCRSYSAHDIKRLSGDVWRVTVHASRNF